MALFTIMDKNGKVCCFSENPYNLNGERNKDNTRLWAYNCAGYALNTFNWVSLYPDFEFRDYIQGIRDFDDNWIEQVETAEEEIYCSEHRDEIDLDEILDDVDDCMDRAVENLDNDDYRIKVYNNIFGWNCYRYNLAVKLSIEHLLGAFDDLRRIHSFDELKEDEYGIAMAMSQIDYHFVKYEDGVISHKRGGLEIEIAETLDDAFGEYDSKRFFFAKKKKTA